MIHNRFLSEGFFMYYPDPLSDFLIIGIFLLFITVIAYFCGKFLFCVYSGTYSETWFGYPERWICTLTKTNRAIDVNWKEYGRDLLIFNLFGCIFLYLILVFQGFLPFNVQNIGTVDPITAFNTAVSFTTNTNWQAYAGESILTNFLQMFGLTVQNFLSAATGICVAIR